MDFPKDFYGIRLHFRYCRVVDKWTYKMWLDRTLKCHLSKHRAMILHEARQMNGFMQLLMKQRNTGTAWTKADKTELKSYLRRMVLYVPVLLIFLLPFGMFFLPILAEIMDRRKVQRSR